MTKEQLQELIATKIQGQGNQIDVASVVTDILEDILDMLPNN